MKKTKKTIYKMGEIIYKWCGRLGLNLQIYKQLIQLNIINKTTQSENGQMTLIHIFQRTQADGQ